MKTDAEYISSDDNALLTLIDRVDLDTETDIIVVDFPDCKTQRDDNVIVDYSDLLEFDF